VSAVVAEKVWAQGGFGQKMSNILTSPWHQALRDLSRVYPQSLSGFLWTGE